MVDENGMAYGMIWSESSEVTKPEGGLVLLSTAALDLAHEIDI